jgi:hypothetical protein
MRGIPSRYAKHQTLVGLDGLWPFGTVRGVNSSFSMLLAVATPHVRPYNSESNALRAYRRLASESLLHGRTRYAQDI